MIRLYFVYEPDENSGVMVAAESNNQAKMLGCSDICCDYIDARARLVKGGDRFYDDIDDRNTGIEITGKGTIETDPHGVLDWNTGFKKTIMDIGRGILFDDREPLDHETEDVVFEGDGE